MQLEKLIEQKKQAKSISIVKRAALLVAPSLANNVELLNKFVKVIIEDYNKNACCVIYNVGINSTRLDETELRRFICDNKIEIGKREVVITQEGIKYSDNFHTIPKLVITQDLPNEIVFPEKV